MLHIDQIEAIKKLMVDIFSGEPWNDHWTDEQLHAYVAQLIGHPDALAFGLFQDERLVGIALGRIIHWYEGTEYWIDEFGLHPQVQQKGIGSEFMEAITQRLADQGVSYVLLLTDRRMPAFHFYRKNGFSEKEETVCFVKKIQK